MIETGLILLVSGILITIAGFLLSIWTDIDIDKYIMTVTILLIIAGAALLMIGIWTGHHHYSGVIIV